MFLRSILAAVPALLIPLSAAAQVAPDSAQAPAEKAQPTYKYEAYAGFGYTSLNQVNQSRYGLMGVNLSVTRDWGRYFGLGVVGNYYKPALHFGNSTATITNGSTTTVVDEGNPGDPSVYVALIEPEVHAQIYGNVSGFFHGGMGVEHTGGEGETPNLSFAGAVGGGLSYNLSPRFAIRASGDRTGASFSLRDNPGSYSPHRTWNSSATIGLVYRF